MRRLLLTGAGGFLGSALAARLRQRRDFTVAGCSRRGPADVVVELCDGPGVSRILEAFAPDIVVHAAGRVRGAPSDLYRDNVRATWTLLEALRRRGRSIQVVILGSASEYGERNDRRAWREIDPCRPLDAYGASKLEAGRQALLYGALNDLDVAVLRVFNVVAGRVDGRHLLGSFLQRALAPTAQGVIEMGWLGAVRDFVTVDDVGLAVEAAIDRRVRGEIINVASGRSRTAAELIEMARLCLRTPIEVRERTERSTQAEIRWSVGDAAKCRALLGVTPGRDLDAVVARAVVDAGL